MVDYSYSLFSDIRKRKKHFKVFLLSMVFIILLNFLVFRLLNPYIDKQERDSLVKNLNLIEMLLDEEKFKLEGYAKSIGRFPDLNNINDNVLLKRRLYNLHTELSIRGIQIRDKDLDLIMQTGSGFDMKKGDRLSENILGVVKEGYTVSFYKENDFFDLQITSVSYISDEFSIDMSGIIAVTEDITQDFLNTIALNTNTIIHFYKNNEIKKKNNKELLVDVEKLKGKGYYIKRQNVNGTNYLIGYLPIKDFYNHIIGYLTVLKPGDKISDVFYKFVILSLIYTAIIIYFSRKIYYE